MSKSKIKDSAKGAETERQRFERLLHDNQKDGIEYRRKIFKELIEHLRQGYTINCWEVMDTDTIMRICQSHAAEFDKLKIEDAIRAGQKHWQELGTKQVAGLSLGNASAWKFGMSAKYGWTDKVEHDVRHSGNVAVSVVSYKAQASDKGSES